MEGREKFEHRAAERHGLEPEVREFPAGTETAADAADAIGCDVAQIASSIALVADELVVVVTSGANRVDTRALATMRGVHTARMAEPDEVADALGYEVGGVPPICHDSAVPVYLDETLAGFGTVWAAAGSPNAVFPIDPDRLVELTGATVADLAE